MFGEINLKAVVIVGDIVQEACHEMVISCK